VLRKIQFEVLLLNANYDDYLKATPTPPPSSAARVCACDVPVDKFSTCVCESVGVPEQVRVIFTTKSANGAKLLALQLSNAIAQKEKIQKKYRKKIAKYVSRRTLSFLSNFSRPPRT